jgi:arylsulfatase A-like enzyme
MTRKFFYLLAFAFLFLQTSLMFAQTQKPNFVVIMADDLGFADLSINGSTQIHTPNIDTLAKKGIWCTNAYVSSAVCSPSRAGFMTGINQVRFGHDNNIGGTQPGFDSEYLGLPTEQKTIPDLLKKQGYISGLIGKWHLGEEVQFHPLRRGFDEFWGYTGGGHDYFTSMPDGEGYLSPLECNYKTPSLITYITDDIGNECVDFISRNKQTPFFLFAAFNAPHAPMQATAKDLTLYNHIENVKRRTYAAMVHRLDVNVGKIVAALEKDGLLENTVVVFLSDNGGPVEANASLNAPFNGQKGILLEGGIHVPFFISWPTHIAPGQIYEPMVSSLDILPTFLALAGGSTPEGTAFDGVNLTPYLHKVSESQPHEELLWRFTISAAIRQGDWKLVRLPDRFPMLYNLRVDISEQNDVSFQNIEKTKELLKRLGEWDVSLPHPVFLEGAVWKRRQLSLYDREYQLEQPKK